jgi:hypothetical protein
MRNLFSIRLSRAMRLRPRQSFTPQCSFAARNPQLRRVNLVLLVVAAWTVALPEGRASDKGESKGKRPDYRELVKGLVSPNEPIQYKDSESDHDSLPAGYDPTAQARVEKNRRLLYEHCEEALPFLMEGCLDSRYSLTWQSDSYLCTLGVGNVCLEIVAAHVEMYREHMRFSKTDFYAYSFVPRLQTPLGGQVSDKERKEIEQWWRTRKGKSLLELQIEADRKSVV